MAEENQDPAVRAAVTDFRDAHEQFDDDVTSVKDENDKMVNAFDALLEEVTHLQGAVEEAETERDKAEKALHETIPDMLKDVERGSHSLPEVIQRVRDFEYNR